ncbi:hypothetical protein MTBLM1_40128 [Rhodospirillaceae bacterium LM-1]|nr:hypothetical protein MTBLM1_40128 [Rhodospirillaceae bacterium LM-1]
MKILFVYPEKYLNIGIPGGIAILSAQLKLHGHQVALFDSTFVKPKALKPPDSPPGLIYKDTGLTLYDLVANDPVSRPEVVLQAQIDEFKPDLIALSAMTQSFDYGMNLLRSVRYDAKLIVGGVHPTIAPDDCWRQPEIDILCIGEGDYAFPEVCDLMEAGERYTDVPSLQFRLPDGTIKRNPLGGPVDLDGLPCPDWGLFDQRHLFRPFEGKNYLGSFYSQSRGCPMRCTYCTSPTLTDLTYGPKNSFRIQKPEVTITHITELKNKFGATWFKFSDDTFLLPPVEKLQQLARGLKPLNIMFGCSVMPNTIREEKVLLAKEMGCVAMTVGVESGNPEIRKKIMRNYTNEHIVKSLRMIESHGIRVSTFNLIGLPGETRQNVFETIELNRRAGARACNVYIVFPYPGTPIQMEYRFPLRGDDGDIIPISRASELSLSHMSEEELKALEFSFNYYLILPKALWPLVRLAESGSHVAKSLRDILQLFVQDVIADIEIVSIPLELFGTKLDVPERLSDLQKIAFSKQEQAEVLAALASYAKFGNTDIPVDEVIDNSPHPPRVCKVAQGASLL